MTRRSIVFGLLLTFVLVIAAVGIVSAVDYSEAPMLAEKVAAGKLPALKDRLPEEPLVETPLESVGVYGGTLRRGITGRMIITVMYDGWAIPWSDYMIEIHVFHD